MGEGYIKKVIIEERNGEPKRITLIDDRGRKKTLRFSTEYLPVIHMMIASGQLKLKDVIFRELK
jgi:rRNA maturation protein Rpf1